jgi:DNA helicase-2/ATP-dependent DNA helicase PcrA
VRDDADQALRRRTGARPTRGRRPLKAQAVLFRTAQHSVRLELELTRRNIPFVKFGGLKFLEAAHVKDVLALLRWAQNPRDHLPREDPSIDLRALLRGRFGTPGSSG